MCPWEETLGAGELLWKCFRGGAGRVTEGWSLGARKEGTPDGCSVRPEGHAVLSPVRKDPAGEGMEPGTQAGRDGACCWLRPEP